jgi:hypothetical protein
MYSFSLENKLKRHMTKNDLINTWLLISFELRKEGGETIYPFGNDVAGRLTYSSSGYFSAQVMQKNRPLFKSEDQMKGSIDEVKENFKGVISYFGSYTVEKNVITHHVEESLFPNWKGLSMKRFAKLENGFLELSTEPTTWQGENSIGIIIWKKGE